jgi:hypothetical protein
MERLEIIDSGRRRRFSKEKKLQIVAVSYLELACVRPRRGDMGFLVRNCMNGDGWHERGSWKLRLTWALSRHCLFKRQSLQQDHCRRQVGLRLSAQMATV